jgi:tetratricopeptide (TPR) repeat protein
MLLGDAYAESKNFGKALSSYLKALELSPEFPISHYKASFALKALGRMENALHFLAKSKELLAELKNPNDPVDEAR